MDMGHKIYTGSGRHSSKPYVLFGDQVWRPMLGDGLVQDARLGTRPSYI
jgi:hypothetical protein